VFKGTTEGFCTGLALSDLYQKEVPVDFGSLMNEYMDLLRQISTCNLVTIAMVEGVALGGGVGVAAACDVVIATPSSSFGLPEALWDILPACLLPYLIRRVGPQKANLMAMSAMQYSGHDAQTFGLVDVVSSAPAETLRTYLIRFSRISSETVQVLKSFSRKLWIVSDEVEKDAVLVVTQLLSSEKVKNNVLKYYVEGIAPWRKE
jgi:polyketide biosynthesis enoyl-CoA hydratase PksH